MKNASFISLFGALFVLGVGCGSRSGDKVLVSRLETKKDAKLAPADQAGEIAGRKNVGGQAPKDVERKITYTADISLITEDFPKGEETLKQLVKTHKGYFAKSEIMGSPGATRRGFWKVRVPVKEFEAFREAVLKIAEVEKNSSDSEDVTEEYYDLENHIKNKLAEEESLRKLLEKVAEKEKMENLLIVRRELSQVRDEIQRKQGRLKLLENLTDMTTVNVTIRERQKYDQDEAPKVAEDPTFGRRVGRTFSDSWGALKDLGQFLALLIVGLVPWSPILLAIGLPLAWALRKARKKMAEVAMPVQGAPASSPTELN